MSLSFERELTGDRWIPRTKGQEMFPFDDVIMLRMWTAERGVNSGGLIREWVMPYSDRSVPPFTIPQWKDKVSFPL